MHSNDGKGGLSGTLKHVVEDGIKGLSRSVLGRLAGQDVTTAQRLRCITEV